MFFATRSQHHLFVAIVFLVIMGRSFFSISQTALYFPAVNHNSGPFKQRIVEVIGTVSIPGIYLFSQAPTIDQVIEKAGGRMYPNLERFGNHDTRVVQSGTKIQVSPRLPESLSSMNAPTAFIAGLPMDINTASSTELSFVPRISKSLALRIVTFRETYGDFRTWKDLEQVNGIGSKTAAHIKNYLRICIATKKPQPSHG
jgi:competence protein ComEA